VVVRRRTLLAAVLLRGWAAVATLLRGVVATLLGRAAVATLLVAALLRIALLRLSRDGIEAPVSSRKGSCSPVSGGKAPARSRTHVATLLLSLVSVWQAHHSTRY
jgi:hypothetical protein